jgi:erythromycin esterase-like protein
MSDSNLHSGDSPSASILVALALALIGSSCGTDENSTAAGDVKDVAQEVVQDLTAELTEADLVADQAPLEGVIADGADADSQAPDIALETVEEVIDSGLPKGIYPIAGHDPGLPHDDLAPLGVIIGDAKVVALGESMHTSKGYYQAKHRLFKYLVEEEGFRILAFESNWTPAENINAYVQSCQGDPAQLVVDNLLYTWTGQSVSDLVEWMCLYNQEHPDDPVHFYGFDVQQTWLDGPALVSYLEQVVPDLADEFAAGVAQCRCTTSNSHADCVALYGELGKITDEELQLCVGAVEDVESWFLENEAQAIQGSSADELEYARLRAIGIKRNTTKNYYKLKGDWGKSYEHRDWAMAYAFNKFREMRFPEAKIALWAHNWHIAQDTPAMTEPAVTLLPVPVGLEASTGTGTILRQQLGDEYIAIGLHAYHLSVNWEGVRQGAFPPHTETSLEGVLHSLGQPGLLVDLAFPGAETPFLEPGKKYPAAIFEGVGDGVPVVPADQYRAILFLDDSPGMDPLMW